MKDVTGNYHGGNEESREAFELLGESAEADRRRILGLARRRGTHGVISDEAEVALNLRHQTCSARISELKRDGLLWPIDATRRTRQGRNARVLVARDVAVENGLKYYVSPRVNRAMK
jgi:hypothetical protein